MKRLQQLKGVEIAVGVLGLLVLVLAAIMLNQMLVRSRLSARVNEQKQLLSNLTEGSIGNRTALSKYDDMSIKLYGRIPDGSVRGSMPFVLNQVAGTLRAHGLMPETLKPESVTVIDGINRVPLKVSFSAGLNNMVLVLRDIENTVPVMRIDQLSIRPAADKSQMLHAEMTISSFVAGGGVAGRTAPAGDRESNASRGS